MDWSVEDDLNCIISQPRYRGPFECTPFRVNGMKSYRRLKRSIISFKRTYRRVPTFRNLSGRRTRCFKTVCISFRTPKYYASNVGRRKSKKSRRT